MMPAQLREVATRERTQAPPAWVLWESLARPLGPQPPRWLELEPGEVEPKVLDAVRPAVVVWSSLWAKRPRDRVRFEIRPAGAGCAVRWRLLSPDPMPEPAQVRALRHRLNYLVNGRLRATFDL